MVEHARVGRLSGEETVIRAHDVVGDDGDDDVNIDPAEGLEGRAPEWGFNTPFRDDREVDGGGDDGEVMDEEGEKRRMGETDVDGGREDTLNGTGQAPEVGEQRASLVARDERKAGEESGKVAEVEGDGIVHAHLT